MTYYRNISNVPTELRLLLGAACNGTIDADGMFRLESHLRDDGRAMDYYLDCIELHGDIYRVLKWRRIGQTVPVELPDALPAGRPVLGFLGDAAHWTREYFSQPGPLSILAATIFMVCMISILSILPAPTYERSRSNHVCTTSTSGTGLRGVDKDGKFKFVARITGLHNCRWADNYLPPLSYAHLGLGRELKLDSGLVQITYYNGAKVVLEGPVEFTVEQKNACRLDVGKLIAKVPKPAAGFTVETPGMSIVDLGTEFAAEVTDAGPTEVHIFVGEIEVEYAAENGATARKQRLKAGQAARFDAQGRLATILTADRDRFLRHIPSSWNTLGPDHFLVLAHYRLGEDDPDAVAESPGNPVTTDDRRRRHLEKHGSPIYTSDTAAPGSSLAMDFNAEEGDDHYYYAKSPVFVGTDNWILEAWVNANSTGDNAIVAYNGYPGGPGGTTGGYGIYRRGNKWIGLFGNVAFLNFDVNVAVDQWTHLALVRETGTTKLYVNGTPAVNEHYIKPTGLQPVGLRIGGMRTRPRRVVWPGTMTT